MAVYLTIGYTRNGMQKPTIKISNLFICGVFKDLLVYLMVSNEMI
jgi:hypothetical protein